MKTTFTTNAIRAALVLLLSSTATPRGFQENGNVGNRQGSAPRAAAPARSGATAPLR